MKKNKNKVTNTNEEVNQVKSLLIITAVIILIAIGLYYLTEAVLSKKQTNGEPKVTINYEEITLGTMFDKKEKEYYVLVYKESASDKAVYDALYKEYTEKEESKAIYKVNLDLHFNSYAISDKTNPKPANSKEVEIKGQALFLIKNNKVSSYYGTLEDMKTALK